jgi:selenocysteine-specific elongation factor
MSSVVFGTSGHIDHGKSALVRALTGTDPDRLKEEKARGITIDLGFAHFEADGLDIALVDVPGHERFVKNMLAGASGIDFVLLVIAADESVMPQTREHFDICRLLRVGGGVIALTKADLVDRDTLELVRLEVRDLVKGTFLDPAAMIPVSSKTGEGLAALKQAMVALAHERAGRAGRAGGVTRLPIDRAFTVKGFGTVVTGTLASGEIGDGDELALLPAGRLVKVRGVQVHGLARPTAGPGQRTAVNLGGIEVGEVERGQTLARPGALEPTDRADVIFESLPSARPLKHSARVRFHQGTTEVLGRIALAGLRGLGGVDAPSLQVLNPGESAYARVRLESPAVLTRGDRYVVRAYSPPVTIGGGVVLDPHPSRVAIRTPAGRRRFERLDAGGPDEAAGDEAVTAMVEERGAAGLPIAALVSRAAIAPGDVDRAVARLAAGDRVVRAGDVLVSPRVVANLRERLLADLRTHHDANPLSEGVPREELRDRLFRRASAAVFAQVVDALSAQGRIVARERVALAGHHVSLSPAEAQARTMIESTLRAAGLTPPDVAALREAAGVPVDVADRVIALMVRQKMLVRLEAMLFHASALEGLKADIAGLKTGGAQPRIDVAAFKDRYGVTRKYAIPLLEYLDRERVTRRVGDGRVVI